MLEGVLTKLRRAGEKKNRNLVLIHASAFVIFILFCYLNYVSLPSSVSIILQHFKLHPRDHLGLEQQPRTQPMK